MKKEGPRSDREIAEEFFGVPPSDDEKQPTKTQPQSDEPPKEGKQ